MPKISIVIPAYNVGPWIGETLKSVQQQTFKDFECIVVDDKSTDNTADIVDIFCKEDARFRLVKGERNRGVSVARNTGIDIARGEYISFLDGDDLWHAEFLSEMLDIIQKKDAWVAYSHFLLFKDGTNIQKPLIWDNLLRTNNIWWDMLMITEFHLCSWMGKLDIVRSIGGFNPDLKIGEDRDFLLRLLEKICSNHLDKVSGTEKQLLFYRQRSKSAVHNAQEALRVEWNMMYPHIEHRGVPLNIRRRAWSFLALKMAVISALGAKNYKKSFGWYLKAIYHDVFNINIYWLPLSKFLNIYSQFQKKRFYWDNK